MHRHQGERLEFTGAKSPSLSHFKYMGDSKYKYYTEHQKEKDMLACYLLQYFFTALRSSFLGTQIFLILSHCYKRVCYTSRDQPREKKQLAQSKRGI